MLSCFIMEDDQKVNKSHHAPHSGPSARKKAAKSTHVQELTNKQKNPKAFAIQNINKVARSVRRTLDVKEKKHHIPVVSRESADPPPILVAVIGPPKVGKTTLIQCLIRDITRHKIAHVEGPLTLVFGKKRRLTLMECNNDINSMIDLAKIADLALVLIDASFGFEMEVFEFLNICQVHGFPRIMGVLTHLDYFKQGKALRNTKKRLKHRFWTEVYAGAKLFYLSGLIHGEYLAQEIHNLGRFISVMKFRPLQWRNTHPFILADRIEDISDAENVRKNKKVDRTVCLYGYVRGTHLKAQTMVHMPGCGDFLLHDVSLLPDPCPLPETAKKRSLNERDRIVYAPMSGVGGVVYDKDAVYVQVGGHQIDNQEVAANQFLASMMDSRGTIDDKLEHGNMTVFQSADHRKYSDHCDEQVEEELIGEVCDSDRDHGDVSDEDSGNDEEESCDDSLSSEKQNRNNRTSDGNKEHVKNNQFLNDKDKKGTIKDKSYKKIIASDGRVRRKVRFEDSDLDMSDNSDDEMLSYAESDEDDVGTPLAYKNEATKVEGEDFAGLVSKIKSRLGVSTQTKEFPLLERNAADQKNASGDSDEDDEFGDGDSSCEMNETEPDVTESDSSSGIDNVCVENDGIDMAGKKRKQTCVDQSCKKGRETKHSLNEDSECTKKETKSRKKNNEDSSEVDSALRWKENIGLSAKNRYQQHQMRTPVLRKMIYSGLVESDTESEDEEEVGGLFKIKQGMSAKKEKFEDRDDCSFAPVSRTENIELADLISVLKDEFTTGTWGDHEDAEKILQADDEMFGDFEDLETGEVVASENIPKKDKEGDDDDDDQYVDESRMMTAAQFSAVKETKAKAKRAERKKQLKDMFDAQYDAATQDDDYFSLLKSEANDQAQLNREEFADISDDLRVQYEGFRPGLYVRVQISGVPCELVENFEPAYPLILGGLLGAEQGTSLLQARFKKHRWHKRILKTKDPVIISLGWRRFQSIMLYAMQDHNMRQRLLKYTPQHMHCHAHFFGPITPQGTGLLALTALDSHVKGFRVAATGSIVELDKSSTILKKLKLIGHPLKVYKKTAFIGDMFSSALEVARFEGSSIRTVSGIRGQIKAAIAKPFGAFRATFEDQIKMSDIVFAKTWYPVEVPKYYNPITSLLLPKSEKTAWTGMKTVGQLRFENNIKVTGNEDSRYREVQRPAMPPKPLQVPLWLQKDLPFASKPKVSSRLEDPVRKSRVPVVLEPKQAKIKKLVKIVELLHQNKKQLKRIETKEKAKKHNEKMALLEGKYSEKARKRRKALFRMMAQAEKHK